MHIPDFTLERYFARYEFSTRYLLSSSDCESVAQAELLAMAGPETRALWDELRLGYTESPGHPLLREAIAGLYAGLTADDVLIAAPEEAILIALNVLLEPGDHALVTFPGYQSLYTLPEALGAAVTRWPLVVRDNAWQIDLAALEAALTERTRLLVINFPHNPTGYLPARADFDALVDLARRRGLWLFSDEIYRFLEYDPARRLPPALELYERSIVLGGLSKSFGLPGLRIGWLATRDRDVLARCARFKDYTTICSSAPSEILALIALRAREQLLARARGLVAQNLRTADAFFARHAARFAWLRPQAGSIAFPQLLGAAPIATFCETLAEREGVMLVPGSVFDFPGNHFRLGLGRKNFPEALARLEAFLQSDNP